MDESTRNDIIHRWHCGQSQRQIARGMHVSRNTIKAVLNDVQCMREGQPTQAETRPARKKRGSLLDAYDGQIREALGRYPYISIVDLHNQLRSAGYKGSYTILRERVKQLRQSESSNSPSPADLARAAALVTYRRVEIELASTNHTPAFLFMYRLSRSGRIYAQFCAGRDLATTLHEHVRAFEHLGGVAVAAQYYRVPLVVERLVEGKPVYNSTFLRFANHYGFRPLSLTGDDPQTDSFGELLYTEMVTKVLQDHQFRSLHHANDVLNSWVAAVADSLPYRDSRPIDLYPGELPQLIPLPAHPWRG